MLCGSAFLTSKLETALRSPLLRCGKQLCDAEVVFGATAKPTAPFAGVGHDRGPSEQGPEKDQEGALNDCSQANGRSSTHAFYSTEEPCDADKSAQLRFVVIVVVAVVTIVVVVVSVIVVVVLIAVLVVVVGRSAAMLIVAHDALVNSRFPCHANGLMQPCSHHFDGCR